MARGRPKVGVNAQKEEALKMKERQRDRDKPHFVVKKSKRERKARKPVPWWKKILREWFPDAMEDVVVEGAAVDAVELLELTQVELKKLKRQFQEIDLDGSEEIDYDEFFEFIEEPRSPYADALFALIDLDGSGTIDFNEYVQVLSTYCMYGKDEILRFCFETFDKDGSGSIDEQEFIELTKTINNMNPTFPGNFQRALTEFDRNDDGLIDFDEFRELNRRYPLILFPAFRLQDRMQKGTLGERRWGGIMKQQQKNKMIEEYMKKNDGQLPPDTFNTRVYRACCPCLYKKSKYELLFEEQQAGGGQLEKSPKGKKKKKKKKKKGKAQNGAAKE